jgi:E3 ubiquitin-protein ligase UBR1
MSRRCQRTMGLYLNIRKCSILYFHGLSGVWASAPYTDVFGEVDPGLRHSRPLYLNQKRYDGLLRTVWLQHGVPSIISRKLEAESNQGGWDTL